MRVSLARLAALFLEVPVRRTESPTRLAVYHFPKSNLLAEKGAKILCLARNFFDCRASTVDMLRRVRAQL
jgi:hypothetical protein